MIIYTYCTAKCKFWHFNKEVLIYTLANKQELLKENKRAKSRRIGTHLLSSIFLNYRLGRGALFSETKKRTVSKNEAQTTKHAEGIYRPTGLTKDFFILENTVFQEKIQKLKTVFFFGDHLFLHQFFPMKMVISKKKKICCQ